MGVGQWAFAFGLTLLVEVPIYAAAFRRVLGWWNATAVGVGANLATHPLLWLAFAALQPAGWWWLLTLVVGELLVVLAETMLVAAALGFPRGWRSDVGLQCALANLCSVLAGLIVAL